MCAAVTFEVKPLKVAATCRVWAVESSTTVVKPVPPDIVGGFSFAAERFAVKVIGSAVAEVGDTIRAATTANASE